MINLKNKEILLLGWEDLKKPERDRAESFCGAQGCRLEEYLKDCINVGSFSGYVSRKIKDCEVAIFRYEGIKIVIKLKY